MGSQKCNYLTGPIDFYAGTDISPIAKDEMPPGEVGVPWPGWGSSEPGVGLVPFDVPSRLSCHYLTNRRGRPP